MINKQNKNDVRAKRHQRIRNKIQGTSLRPRLSVYRSTGEIYAQLIDDEKHVTIASASSVDKDLQNGITRYAFHVVTNGGNLNVRSGPGFGYSVIGQFANGQVIDVSFWQESGIYPWVYATGTDCNTGNYIGGYIHSDYYQ